MTWARKKKRDSAANGSGKSNASDAASAKTVATAASTEAANASGVMSAGKPTGARRRGIGRGGRAGRAVHRRDERGRFVAPQEELVRTLRGHAYRRVNQGTAVVEPQDAANGGGFLVMTPHGDVCQALSHAHAVRIIKAWAKRHMRVENGVGLLKIEWR
jgi:hypothetical protein